MSHNHNIDKPRKIANLKQYVKLRTIRANTALINGKIILDGREYCKEVYEYLFPKPELKYIVQQLDKTQVQNS